MRKMKGSGSYLKNQVRKNLAKAAVCLVLFGLIFFLTGLRALLKLNFDFFEVAGLLVSLVPLAAFYFYLRKYRIYSGGWEGEKQVTKLLGSTLSDDYIILNDLYLRGGGGDIDHIVLAPTGIFVLETKNWSGEITCNGDKWQRTGKKVFSGSPSRQVKRNAATIRRIVDSSRVFGARGMFIEGIVVFTNNHATLHLNNPAVLILKLAQLPNHIMAQQKPRIYSREQLEAIGKEILAQKH